uniref:thiamine pyrophosphate-dependent enzyme n=1 Tax=uncultured Sulfitobacter sp. TaxID=191468 RepID=UPI0025937F2B
VVNPKTASDFKGKVEPDWCAGCGDFGVLNSLRRACVDLELNPHEILTVSGIGCSSNFPGYFNSFGMHTLHGRSLAVATGAKMANHELTVVVTGGDGDGYGIGGNHFTHTARRNLDILLRELPGLEHVPQDQFDETFEKWAKGYTLRPEEG